MSEIPEETVTFTGFTSREVTFIAVMYNLIYNAEPRLIYEMVQQLGMEEGEMNLFLEKCNNEL